MKSHSARPPVLTAVQYTTSRTSTRILKINAHMYYVCMYICMYPHACMYVCAYVYICTCMCICMHVCSTRVCMYVYMHHVCMYVYMHHVCMCVCMYVRVCIMYACMYMYAMYAYMHVCELVLARTLISRKAEFVRTFLSLCLTFSCLVQKRKDQKCTKLNFCLHANCRSLDPTQLSTSTALINQNYLRQTVSRQLCLGIRPLFGTRDRLFLSMEIILRYLQFFIMGCPL
jgi:hypothetical protein